MQSVRHLSVFVTVVTVLSSVLSCKSYDEQDVTIIAYLKANDLIEQKLSQTCEAEISQFDDDYSEHVNLMSADFFGITDVFYDTFGYNARANDPMLKYEANAINTFFANFYDEETESFRTDKLEAQISSDLWDYMANLYTDALPAKAQNVEEGRYYTITELKQKYPEYNEVEVIDFSPMPLLNLISDEKLFGNSAIDGNPVNLRTLYSYYIINKQLAESIDSELEILKYRVVIDSHFPDGIPDDLDIDAVISLYHKLSKGNDAMYTDDMAGFEKFANDYFETDMFTGEACD